MPIAPADAEPSWEAVDTPADTIASTHLAGLEEAFGQPFSLLDAGAGRLDEVSPGWLGGVLLQRQAVCEAVACRGKPEVIEECGPVLVLGVPLAAVGGPPTTVAVSLFLTGPAESPSQVAAAAESLGLGAEQVLAWAKGRARWPAHAVVSLADAWLRAGAALRENSQLKGQVADVSTHLLNTFEELSLLHRLTARLSISSTEAELCELALAGLAAVIPAECLVAILEPPRHDRQAGERAGREVLLLGEPVLDEADYTAFVEHLGPEAPHRCLVLNRSKTAAPGWRYPAVREVVCVPIRTSNQRFGWLLALNFRPGDGVDTEFGTIEASLLASVAAIVGIHAGNIDLYRERSEFFQSVIRALSSAIDAKDPYTCGHSDRVARIAVCLARRLGCDPEELNTVYLSGLLHDIGKIGIDDTVLRKPGRLTKGEYEHIKTHPQLGHRILAGVKQLDSVLPVVLHHHEAWNGGGYPSGLVGEECPRLARIMAVADSIDAMGSDRPYRKGMPAERMDGILAEGAGRQWDPEVVRCYFEVREEVRRITSTDAVELSLDVREWSGPLGPSGNDALCGDRCGQARSVADASL